MSTFQCPACKREYDISDYPDHLSGLGPSGRLTFECDGEAIGDEGCSAEFQISIDWDPSVYVLKETLKVPPTGDTK